MSSGAFFGWGRRIYIFIYIFFFISLNVHGTICRYVLQRKAASAALWDWQVGFDPPILVLGVKKGKWASMFCRNQVQTEQAEQSRVYLNFNVCLIHFVKHYINGQAFRTEDGPAQVGVPRSRTPPMPSPGTLMRGSIAAVDLVDRLILHGKRLQTSSY